VNLTLKKKKELGINFVPDIVLRVGHIVASATDMAPCSEINKSREGDA
jgi:hypothetical protein